MWERANFPDLPAGARSKKNYAAPFFVKTPTFTLFLGAGMSALIFGACSSAPAPAKAPAAAPVNQPVAEAPVTVPVAKPVAAMIDFETQVRPFLTQHCYSCHGPTVALPPGGVNMGVKKSVMRAIAPGSPFTSLLFKAIYSGSMPPRGQPRLSPAEIAMMQQWITQGANWPESATP
jgi:uncharacterized membrane protein